MAQRKPNQSPKRKQHVVLGVIVVLLLIAGAFMMYQRQSDKAQQTPAANEKARNQVNYNPPTEDERKAGDNQKETDVKQQENQQPATTASVVITNTSQADTTVRVRAMVTNAVESGGTCTTTLKKDAKTITKETTAFGDASSTQCGAIDFTRDQFDQAGDWAVTVTYHSDKLQGTATGTITIQ